MKQNAEVEKQRIKDQTKTLGKQGLKRKADELEDATDENEVIYLSRFLLIWVSILSCRPL